MIFIGGVFIPIQALPLQLRVVSYLTPLTYVIDALREAMMVPSAMFAVDIMALLTWIAVLQTAAIVVLKRRTQV
jgi:ABC-type multidrug transport system permease subunit